MTRIFNKNREGGFSLIEILIAITIFAAIAVTITEVMGNIFRTRNRSEARSEVRHAMTVGLSKMYDDFNMAFITDATFVKTAGLIGDKTTVNFSTMSHMHFVKNARDTDQVAVGYSLTRNDKGTDDLIRRETDSLPDKLDKGGKSFVLIPEVKTIEFSYYDANQKDWKEQWDTNSVSSAGALPSLVKIALTVLGPYVDEDQTERREFSTEMLVPVALYNQKLSF